MQEKGALTETKDIVIALQLTQIISVLPPTIKHRGDGLEGWAPPQRARTAKCSKRTTNYVVFV
jgi:hypothetical protein